MMTEPTDCVLIEVCNCLDCPFHEALPDPDPDDWFCTDDMKVVCKKAEKEVTVSCRPHHLREECDIPKWCPWRKEPMRDLHA